MKFLVIGSGGREHALVDRLAQSNEGYEVFALPGNPGTAQLATNLPGDPMDFAQVAEACQVNGIEVVIPGPEAPLVRGLSNYLREREIAVLGPSADAARLEGSKQFAKAFMQRHNIPTAPYRAFERGMVDDAVHYLTHEAQPPFVVKANGLAAGKGVIITEDRREALAAMQDMMVKNRFGDAGQRIVVEQYLEGVELSVIALCAGEEYFFMPHSKDYKRVAEHDQGPNTGGMGAVSPVKFASQELLKTVQLEILQPTLSGLFAEGMPFNGFLYMGLMLAAGKPYLLEYNVRLGDPEAQVILPRISGDFAAACASIAQHGTMRGNNLAIRPQAACAVVCASEGYPGSYEKGKVIDLKHVPEAIKVYHAGTAQTGGQLVTNGGRVLSCLAMADELGQACEAAQLAAEQVVFQGRKYRKDIGRDVLSEA